MPCSGDTQGEECRRPFVRPLKGKNVAYLFSDRSRALAQAYVLKKVRRHSFLNSIQMKGKRHSLFLISKICSSYGKIRLYARQKIASHRDSRGGVV